MDFKNGQLSQHFKASESIVTQYGENTPTDPVVIRNIRLTAFNLEKVRLFLGERGITVTSWYRNSKVNAAAGGSATSEHMTGAAADFKHAVFNNKQVFEKLSTPEAKAILGYDQLIYYPKKSICHIGWRFDGRPNRLETKTL